MQNNLTIQTNFIENSIHDGVLNVTINRPERKNAMNHFMWLAVAELFNSISEKPEIRAVILQGAGKDFCAGADISEFETLRATADKARIYEAGNSAAFAAIRNCPVPTIAAIRGICFGGGFGIAAACDLRLASSDAVFCVPAAKLGLAYPVDAMSDIVNSLGAQLAKYLAFTASRIDSSTALAKGFLLEVAEDKLLEKRALEIATGIAKNAPLSVRASKASIGSVLSASADDIAHAVSLGDLTFESTDYAEGRAAFREKRSPEFLGR